MLPVPSTIVTGVQPSSRAVLLCNKPSEPLAKIPACLTLIHNQLWQTSFKIGGSRFASILQMWTILSTCKKCSDVTFLFKIPKTLMRWMQRSTWIRWEATLYVSRTSSSDSCSLAQQKGGITSVTFLSLRSLLTCGKHLSASTTSGSNRLTRPQLARMYVSLDWPPYTFEMKLIYPDGVIPTRNFKVKSSW